MSGPALSRHERQILRGMERELREDAELDTRLRAMCRSGSLRHRGPRELVAEYSLVVLIPVCAVLTAASIGGAPTAAA